MGSCCIGHGGGGSRGVDVGNRGTRGKVDVAGARVDYGGVRDLGSASAWWGGGSREAPVRIAVEGEREKNGEVVGGRGAV